MKRNERNEMNSEKADPNFCLHQSNDDGITASNLESRGNVVSSSIIFAVTIVIHNICNLIGALGSSEFGPK